MIWCAAVDVVVVVECVDGVVVVVCTAFHVVRWLWIVRMKHGYESRVCCSCDLHCCFVVYDDDDQNVKYERIRMPTETSCMATNFCYLFLV